MTEFHPNTQRLIDYWRSLGASPRRASVDPAHFSNLAPRTFVLGRMGTGLYPFRLAGGFVADLHGRDLRGQNGLDLFRERDRHLVKAALETARRRPEPVVATVQARGDGAELPLEILFAPLAGNPDRFLGLYQPLAMVARLGGASINDLALGEIRGVGPSNEQTPQLRLATLDGRRVA